MCGVGEGSAVENDNWFAAGHGFGGHKTEAFLGGWREKNVAGVEKGGHFLVVVDDAAVNDLNMLG